MKQKNKRLNFRPVIFTALFALISVFFFLTVSLSPVHEPFNTESVCELTSKWYTSDQSFSTDTLPEQFPCDETGTVTVCTILPQNNTEPVNSLAFRAAQLGVRIWLDDELLLEQGQAQHTPSFLGKSPGSSWVLVRLPEDYPQKELRIELSSPYEYYQGLLSKVYLGTKSSLIYHIIHMQAVPLIITGVLLLFSIVLLLFYLLLFTRKIRSRQLLLLGIFGILASIWLFGESQVLQLFTGKLIAWFDLTILALHLLPVPILLIAAGLPDFAYRRFCNGAVWFQFLYLSFLILIQAAGIRDFMEMLPLSLFLLLILCLTVPVLIFRDFILNKNRKILSMAISLSVLGLFACIELIYDLIDLKTYVGTFFQIGLFAFYLVYAAFSISHAMTLFERGLQTSYYRQLSYLDQMTDCKNHRAFVERQNTWTPGYEDGLIMIDLNRVKEINDTLGHRNGDLYITACAEAMHEVFDYRGDCYRLGGDEFLFWCSFASLHELKQLEQQFLEAAGEKCQAISPLCTIATGIAVFSSEDKTIEDTYKRADHNMYERKWLMKEAEYFAAQKKAGHRT